MISFLKMLWHDAHMFDNTVEFDDAGYSADEKYNWDGESPGVLETFNPYKAWAFDLHDTKRIWTIIDAEDGHTMLIVPGFRLVNRCAFFVSNEEWESMDEEYIWVRFHRERFWWLERIVEEILDRWDMKRRRLYA